MDFTNITGYTFFALGVILAIIGVCRYKKTVENKNGRGIVIAWMVMLIMLLITAAGHMDIFLCIC